MQVEDVHGNPGVELRAALVERAILAQRAVVAGRKHVGQRPQGFVERESESVAFGLCVRLLAGFSKMEGDEVLAHALEYRPTACGT